MSIEDIETLMTAEEVAELLKLPISSIYRLEKLGILKAYRIGRSVRFLKKDVLSALCRREGVIK